MSEQGRSGIWLCLAEVGTVTDLCCPDAAEILTEGQEGAEDVCFFHMACAQEKCLSSVAWGGNGVKKCSSHLEHWMQRAMQGQLSDGGLAHAPSCGNLPASSFLGCFEL